MKKKVLGVVMLALALLLGVQLSMEQLFRDRLREMTETMAQTEQIETKVEKEPELFAIFGIDQEKGDVGRSDCILLASLEDGGRLRLCSIARDTLVTIPGSGEETKLGHAYALGGPELAMETINENFDLNVSSYVSVNFTQLAELVDLLGGVELRLTEGEWRYLGLEWPYLGQKRLDGAEALCYSRIRSLDNDNGRMARHRKLVMAMLQSLENVTVSELPGLVVEGMKCCRTNVDILTVMRMGKLLLGNNREVQTETLCLPGDAVTAWGGTRPDGVWYYVYDLQRAAEEIRGFFLTDPKEV